MKAMKKTTLLVLSLLIVCLLAFGLTACGDDEVICEHDWGEWETVTESTCLVKGTETRVCRLCEAEDTLREKPLAEHSFTNYVSDGNASCTQDGTKTATCDVEGCNAKDTDSDFGSMLAHDFSEKVANEKYLISEAYCENKIIHQATYYYSCKCGAKGALSFSYGDYQHSYTGYAHNDDEHWNVCACGKNNFDSQEAHAWDEGKITTPATCTAEGVKTFTCKCGRTRTEAVAKLAHTLTATAAKAPTCVADGNTAYFTCSVCTKYFTDEAGTAETTLAATVIAKTPTVHDFANGTYTITAANHTVKCAHCDATKAELHSYAARQDDTHHWEACKCGSVINKDAHGKTLYAEEDYHYFACTCGYVSVKYEHEETEVMSETPATCISEGEKVYRCRCGELFTETLTKAHVLTEATHTKAVAPTCTAPGNIEYWQCESCGRYFSDVDAKYQILDLADTVIEALGHEFSKNLIYGRNENEHWSECAHGCGTKKDGSIQAHIPEQRFDDKVHYTVCTACGYETSKTEHNMKTVKDDEGHSYECTACGYEILKVAHAWGEPEITKPATCTTDGIATYSCVCGHTKEEKIIALHKDTKHLTGENVTYTAKLDATCDAPGNIEYRYCKTCECYFKDAELTVPVTLSETVIPKLEHSFTNGEWVLNENGESHAKKCTLCGELSEWTNHVISEYSMDKTHHWNGCECGFLAENAVKEEHNLVCTPDSNNDAVHVYTCSACGYSYSEAHDMVYTMDENEHWAECSKCLAKSDVAAHSHTDEKFNTTHHYAECECGHVADKEEHTLTPKHTYDEHWYVCACGYETKAVPHDFKVENGGYCDCGYGIIKED